MCAHVKTTAEKPSAPTVGCDLGGMKRRRAGFRGAAPAGAGAVLVGVEGRGAGEALPLNLLRLRGHVSVGHRCKPRALR